MDLVRELFRHNTMMNDRLLAACRDLSPEQLDATAVGTYGSIGATLVHVANSQVSYGSRFLATEARDRLPEAPFPGFDALVVQMSRGNRLLEESASRAGEDFDTTVTGDDPPGSWTMPAALVLLQAVNHATEHRSQIATILTQLGIEPPNMDGWTYFFDSGQMRAV